MASSTDNIKQTFAIKPCQKLRGETNNVFGVVHLPDVRRIITCSHDDSLLLWDLESGERMGDAWQDDGDDGDDGLGVGRITLSPNGKTVASGSNNGTVRLWDVETKKVVARWTGDDGSDVISLCWSTDGEHVLTGYSEGMIRVWNIRSGNTILGPIKTGHKQLSVATYFDDKTNIATGGEAENAIKIWDSTTGELLSTVKHKSPVLSLASTSDQKKLISGSFDGSIRIFDTATWNQITILHHENRDGVAALALFQDDRLLASISNDDIRLWDLDTNFPVGPPTQFEQVNGAAISADGKVLVTRSSGTYRHYVWDIHTILKDPGLRSLVSISKVLRDTLETLRAARSLSVLNVTSTGAATRRSAKPEHVRQLLQGSFDDARDGIQSSTIPVSHVQPSASRRLSSLFRRSQPTTGEATALEQLPRQSISSHHRPSIAEVPTAQDKQRLHVAGRPELPGDNGKQTQQQQGQSQSQAQALTSQTPPVAATTSTIPAQTTTVGAATTQSQPATTIIQQQGQAQTSQTPPAVTSTSTTSPQVTTAGPAKQSKPVTWWTRLVSFVCCASIDQHR